MNNIRTGDLKLGTFHGTLNPKEGSKEAKLRNSLYLIGNMKIAISKNEEIKIRLIGYEIPIEYKGKRIDLLGYDENKNLCIIELKTDTSKEKIEDVINQIEGYSKIMSSHIETIKKEFKERFYLCLNLTNEFRKIILAPREYYEKQKSKPKDFKNNDIFICSIGEIRNVFNKEKLTIEDNLDKYEMITLKVENK